jgi:hypothetical protein
VAFSLYEGAKTAQRPLTRGVLLALATSNELFARMPFVGKSADAWSYNREKALPTVEFVSPISHTTTESSATFDRVTVPMRLITSDVDVMNTSLNQSDPNGDPRVIQLEQKLKALGQTLAAKMFTGGYATGFVVSGAAASPGLAVDAAVPSANTDSDRFGPGSLKYTHTGTFWQYRAPGDRTYGAQVACATDGSYVLSSDNPNKKLTVTLDVSDATADGEIHITFTSSTNEFDSVNKLCPTGQVVSSSGTDGDALSFNTLDKLMYEKIKGGDKGKMAFFMNGKLKTKFMALCRSQMGGMTTELKLPVLGLNGVSDVYVPVYNGIPIFQVDDIPSTEAKGAASTLSSVYLAELSPERGLYFGVQSRGNEAMANLTPYQARIAGVQMYDIGQRETVGAYRTRVEWFGALALGSELLCARASEIVTL